MKNISFSFQDGTDFRAEQSPGPRSLSTSNIRRSLTFPPSQLHPSRFLSHFSSLFLRGTLLPTHLLYLSKTPAVKDSCISPSSLPHLSKPPRGAPRTLCTFPFPPKSRPRLFKTLLPSFQPPPSTKEKLLFLFTHTHSLSRSSVEDVESTKPLAASSSLGNDLLVPFPSISCFKISYFDFSLGNVLLRRF